MSLDNSLLVHSGTFGVGLHCNGYLADHLITSYYPRFYIPQYDARHARPEELSGLPSVTICEKKEFSLRRHYLCWEFEGCFSKHAIAPLLEYVFEFLRQDRLECTMHASCVILNDKAVLIIGSAKTRLSLELALLGAIPFSDDRTIVDLTTKAVIGGRTWLLEDPFIFQRYGITCVEGYGKFASQCPPSNFGIDLVICPRLNGEPVASSSRWPWQRTFHELYPLAAQFLAIPRPIDYEEIVLPALDNLELAKRRSRAIRQIAEACAGYDIHGSLQACAKSVVQLMRESPGQRALG